MQITQVKPMTAVAPRFAGKRAEEDEARANASTGNTDVFQPNLPGKPGRFSKERKLLNALKESDAAAIRRYLNKNANPNLVDPETGETLLVTAARNNDAAGVETLISFDADVNFTDRNGLTPLYYALANRNKGIAGQILYKKVNRFEGFQGGHIGSLLRGALGLGWTDLAGKMIRQGADVNWQWHDGSTALMATALENDLDGARLLLENDADPNLGDNAGITAIHYAASKGNADLLSLLKEFGGKLDTLSGSRMSPVAEAAKYKKINVFDYLVGQGADLSRTFEKERNIFHFAVNLNADHDTNQAMVDKIGGTLDAGTVKTLLNSGDDNGVTPLHQVFQSKEPDLALALELLKRGADPTITDHQEVTAETAAENVLGKPLVHQAIETGNMTLLENWLTAGASPDAVDAGQVPALVQAVRQNNPEAIETLVRHRANPNLADGTNSTAMHTAAGSDHENRYALAEAILKAEPDLNLKDETGKTPLHLAVERQDQPMVELLLAQPQLDADTGDARGKTALHEAVLRQNPDLLRLLAENGAALEAADQQGFTPLLDALYWRATESAETLLDLGADIAAKTSDGKNVLHWSFANKRHRNSAIDPALFIRLVEASSEEAINQPDREGNTPLMLAMGEQRFDMAEVLIKNGAKLDATNKRGHTPLDLAGAAVRRPLLLALLDGKNYGMMELLLENGAETAIWDKRQWSLVRHAVENRDAEGLKLALAHIENFNHPDLGDVTPLQQAFQTEQYDLAAMILEKRPDRIDDRVMSGNTLLMESLRKKRYPLAETLIAQSADLDAQANMGRTALMQAVLAEDAVGAKILLDAGADINVEDEDGKSALHHALENGQYELAALILEKSPEKIDGVLPSGNSYLAEALAAGQYAVGETLMAQNADPNQANPADGRTPLMQAIGRADEKAVNLLADSEATRFDLTDKQGESAIVQAVLALEDEVDEAGNESHDPNRNEALTRIVNALLSKKPEGLEQLVPRIGGKTLVMHALKNRAYEMADALLEAGADPNAIHQGAEQTALIQAVAAGDVEAAKVLKRHNADSAVPGRLGKTAFHHLAKIDEEKALALLDVLAPTGNDLNLDIACDQGFTPLLDAVYFRKPQLVKALVEKGADIKAKVPRKEAPALHWLFRNKFSPAKAAPPEFFELLLDLGADIDAPDYAGNTPLMRALKAREYAVADLLIDRGADLAARNKQGHGVRYFWKAYARHNKALADKLNARLPEEPAAKPDRQAGNTREPKDAPAAKPDYTDKSDLKDLQKILFEQFFKDKPPK